MHFVGTKKKVIQSTSALPLLNRNKKELITTACEKSSPQLKAHLLLLSVTSLSVVGLIHQGIRGISRLLLGMPILRVLSLPTSRHHLAGSCRVDRSKRERLTTFFIPGLL
uniref:Uncharacterized protein n=1 Tax=Brassica campestris TaxID=3711 RepID=A0A3P6DNM3_BRACM|nr:unnamed protein product [Brassica rapa]